MKTLLMTVCAARLLTGGQGDGFSRLAEAYAALLASPEVRVEDLQAMQTTGRWFSLHAVATSEGTVVSDSLRAVEEFSRVAFADDRLLSLRLRSIVQRELESRASVQSSAHAGAKRVPVEPRAWYREQSFATPAQVKQLVFTPDGNSVLGLLNTDDPLMRWGVKGGAQAIAWGSAAPSTEFGFSLATKAQRLYVKNDETPVIRILDTQSFQWVGAVAASEGEAQDFYGEEVWASSDGGFLAVFGLGVLRRIWPDRPPEIIARIAVYKPHKLTPDERFFATGSDLKSILFTDLNGQKTFLDYSSSFVYAGKTSQKFAFRTGVPEVVIADNVLPQVVVWNWEEKHEVRTLELSSLAGRNKDSYDDIVYSPDGKLIAAAPCAGRVRIWNADTGKIVLEWNTPKGIGGPLVFSPDGRRIATAYRYTPGLDIWRLTLEEEE